MSVVYLKWLPLSWMRTFAPDAPRVCKEDYKGQITFFSQEVFEALRCELNLPHVQPAATRRNVFVSGADFNALFGREFEVQGVRFAGVEECKPCYWMNHALGEQRAENWLKGRGGLRARILRDGWLRLGAGISSQIGAAGARKRGM